MLDAAVALFFEQGPSATSMDAIAGRAGLTKGAIYSSFETKDELFAAAVERLPTTMYGNLIPSGATSGSEVAASLRRFGEAVAKMQPPDPAIALVHELYVLALRNPATRRTISTWVATMINDAARAEPGDARRVRLRVSSRDAWVIGQALLEGLFLRRAINPDLVDDRLIATAMELLAGLVDEDAEG